MLTRAKSAHDERAIVELCMWANCDNRLVVQSDRTEAEISAERKEKKSPNIQVFDFSAIGLVPGRICVSSCSKYVIYLRQRDILSED